MSKPVIAGADKVFKALAAWFVSVGFDNRAAENGALEMMRAFAGCELSIPNLNSPQSAGGRREA
jgi:hypothetical protein